MTMTKNIKPKPELNSEFDEISDAKEEFKEKAVRMNQLETFALSLVRLCVGENVEITCQDRTLPGSPDLVIPMLRLVLFIDGGFWHDGRGAPMKRVAIRFLADEKTEKANFWHKKSLANAKRDREANKKLKQLGYKIVRLKEERLNGYDPLGYVSRAIGLCLFKVK